jgi:hypothetical protein
MSLLPMQRTLPGQKMEETRSGKKWKRKAAVDGSDKYEPNHYTLEKEV